MDYSRSRLERIVIGTMLNEYGDDGFLGGSRMSLREDMFKDRRNAFVFSVLKRMHEDGLRQTTPYDVMAYVREKGIAYGDTARFCAYMCELADENYAFAGFKGYVRKLADEYIRERRYANG